MLSRVQASGVAVSVREIAVRPPRSFVLHPRKTTAEMAERAVDGAEREARIVSLNRFAVLTGRDDKTLPAWIKKGCPIHRDDGKLGKFIDLKEVLLWREEQVRQEERRKFARPDDEDGEGGLSPADLVKLEDLKLKRQKLAMTAKILVHREPLEMGIRQANGLGRQTVMSIPDLVSRLLAGTVDRKKSLEVRQAVWTTCVAAMTSWATEVSAAMRAAADRALEFDDEDEDDGE